MTLRSRLAFLGIAAAMPLIAAVAVTVSVTRPTIAVVLLLSPLAVILARRSIAYPVGIAGIPTLVIAILGRDPFPHGVITATFFGWTFLAIAFALLAGEQRLPLRLLITGPVMFSVLLAIALLARLPASLSPGYGSTKLQLFLLQNLIVIIAGTLIAQRRWHLERLLYVELLLAGAIGVVLLWHLARGDAQNVFANRYTISAQENPIQLGRESADGLIIAIYAVLSATRASTRIAAAALLPVLVVTLLSSGSRGPVLGALVGLVTLFAVLARDRSARRRLLLIAVAGGAATVLATQLVPGQSIQRSLSFLAGSGSGLNSNGRSQLWSEAWSHFLAHPVLGLGTGSFSAHRAHRFLPSQPAARDRRRARAGRAGHRRRFPRHGVAGDGAGAAPARAGEVAGGCRHRAVRLGSRQRDVLGRHPDEREPLARGRPRPRVGDARRRRGRSRGPGRSRGCSGSPLSYTISSTGADGYGRRLRDRCWRDSRRTASSSSST